MQTLFKELKRRNVFRVGIAYLVVAWISLQVIDVLVPIFEIPDWAPRLIVLIMGIGFIIALVFAWAFEMTPDGIKKEKDVDRSQSTTRHTGRKLDFLIIGALSAALLYFVADKFLFPDTVQPVTASQTDERKSIAVLPFVNMSSDPEQEYFSDGLSEELLNLLAKIPDLKVIARTSSFAFKGKNEDLRVIGAALGTKTVLEGSVRKSGDRIRITAQLIDVADNAHLWSETYDRTITDIFAVQDEVAAAIIEALQIHVGQKITRGRPTESAEAYSLLLRARGAEVISELQNAEQHLLSALELDPEFAEAYEALAFNYWYQAGTTMDSNEGQRRTREAAAKALEIDPGLVAAEALFLSANIETYSFFGELEGLHKAFQRDPSNPEVMEAIIFDLQEAGYLQEALEVAMHFVDVDPLSPVAHWRHFETLNAVGRKDEAAISLDTAFALSEGRMAWFSGAFALTQDRHEDAISAFESTNDLGSEIGLDPSWIREFVENASDPLNGASYLDVRIPELVATAPQELQYRAWILLTQWYMLLGHMDRYFEIIEGIDLTETTWTDADTMVAAAHVYRPREFVTHPKYLGIAESIGLIELWEQRGPPDFCDKKDGEWTCR